MHFARTEEQTELAAAVRGLLAKRSDSAAVRAALASSEGYDLGLWATLCEQVGVAALAIPEEHDGFGASLVETAVVLEELGEFLTPTPLLSTALNTCQILLHGSAEEKSSQLPALAGGAVRPFALGRVVLDPPEGAGSMDQTLRLAVVEEPTDNPDDIAAIATALGTALQVGAMQRALDMTVRYAGERVQFGRPIGSFQALKHRMADMLALVESSRSASWGATAVAAEYVVEPSGENLDRLRRTSAVAGSYCTDSAAHVASEMMQLHGGIAITWEHDAHLVFKRVHALGALNGPAHAQRATLLD